MKKYLYLILSLLLVFGLSAAAFSYNEAPELEELVASGELPSLSERLPEKPLVVEPGVLISEEDLDWEVGQYGGTLRLVHVAANWSPNAFCFMREPILIAQGISVKNIRPNIVEDYEVTDDNKIFTFYMREGLKWSDGNPVTTEDVRFAYEDVLLNEQITPSIPSKFRNGGSPDGEPMTLDIIDNYTFRIKFTEPYGGFLTQLTIEGWSNYYDLIKPKHYLKQFHANYTPMDELKPYLEEEELGDAWWDLFNTKDMTGLADLTNPQYVGFPVLYPWKIVDARGGLLRFERNPYYFKVDTAGNQLPYINNMVSTKVNDVEMFNMKIITGEVDHSHGRTSLNKLPLYKENEERGGFETVLLDQHQISTSLYLNHTFEDPVWREVVNDARFKKALSLAIDREEIIESVYYGFASPPEIVPSEFNPELANQLLDDVGFTGKDDEGYRLGPDGDRFEIYVEFADHKTDFIPVSELVAAQIRENLDLNVNLKKISRELWGQRNASNELQATFFWAEPMATQNRFTSVVFDFAAPLWAEWNISQGNSGEEPPAWAKEAFIIDEKRWKVIPDSPEYNELWNGAQQWYHENIPAIPIIGDSKIPVIESADLGNVPHSGIDISNAFSGEQFFFKQ